MSSDSIKVDILMQEIKNKHIDRLAAPKKCIQEWEN